MLATIKFNDNFGFKRTKINDVRTQRLLPSEFKTLKLP